MLDAGAEAVSAGLAGLTRLVMLALSQNNIGCAGALAVAREAARLPALRTLGLRGPRGEEGSLEEATRAAILGMLPHVVCLELVPGAGYTREYV